MPKNPFLGIIGTLLRVIGCFGTELAVNRKLHTEFFSPLVSSILYNSDIPVTVHANTKPVRVSKERHVHVP